MTQQSQVWWSWPGGIGWSTSIPLKGGKRSGAGAKRKTRKGSKKTRKGRKATRRR